ncbi:hypothetical protein PRUPE_6G167900 [Prunus persica]|uniref:Uncharacterized protein n=1 Tax=Prunus persica TaxID=3760 RepID=A0A251NRI3_PRUPE|nr:hypothetical protein PRUPE_6G167900 [Prunus persica]
MLVPLKTDVYEMDVWFWECRIFLDPWFDHMSLMQLWLLPDSRRLVSSGVFTNSCSSGCHGGAHLGGLFGNGNDDDS